MISATFSQVLRLSSRRAHICTTWRGVGQTWHTVSNGALGAGIGLFLVLLFQLCCGFEIFQNKKVRRKEHQPCSIWKLFLSQFTWLCLALPGHCPGFLVSCPFFYGIHSHLFPFLLGISVLDELFCFGLGRFYDRVSFWQTCDFSRSR